MEAAVKTFFSTPRFAVAGASSDPSKYGHKIFNWYIAHSLPVTPLNPRVPSITAAGNPSSTTATTASYSTLPSPSALPSPAETALSIVTPPAATLAILREAKAAGVRAVWLQPGSFDAEVLAYAQREFEAGIGGTDGGRGSEGWCVLVDGEAGLKAAGREGGGGSADAAAGAGVDTGAVGGEGRL